MYVFGYEQYKKIIIYKIEPSVESEIQYEFKSKQSQNLPQNQQHRKWKNHKDTRIHGRYESYNEPVLILHGTSHYRIFETHHVHIAAETVGHGHDQRFVTFAHTKSKKWLSLKEILIGQNYND